MKKMTIQKEFVISMGNCLGNHSEDLKPSEITFEGRAQNPINSVTALFFSLEDHQYYLIINNPSS